MKQIETLTEYQQLASRTCPDLGIPQDNILHMELGIMTEIGETLDIFKRKHAYKKEIDIVNLGEELADQMWYVANLAILTKDPIFNRLDNTILADIIQDNFLIPSTEKKKISVTINILRNILKLTITLDNKGFDFISYISGVAAISVIWDLEFMQILTNNIDKLKVRYPEKFSEEKALNRDLKEERKELEKTEEVNDKV